jgi:1,4-dihydroxy-2-naphthoate octaprenyltransferase
MAVEAGGTGRAAAWWIASRPKTLPAAIAPVLVGSAVAFAAGAFRPGPALAALLGAVMLQIGANLTNDVLDFERGADTAERIGPLRVTQAGLLSPREVWAGAAVVFGVATIAGAYLAAVAGWPVVAIGVASILAALAYTGGPLPLGYNGLGDLFVLLFFGFVAVCGTVYVQAGRVVEAAWPAAAMTGALATAILVVNNVRDLEQDRRAGKRTLPVLLGRRAGRAEYLLLLAAGFALPVAMVAAGLLPAASLLALLTLPLAVRTARVVLTSSDGPRLNAALAGTAAVMVLHAALFAAGTAVGTWLRP